MTSNRSKPAKNSAAKAGEADGELRIIGGSWRGRKLRFPSLPGLRPSPDRVRETLFNWLQYDIAGSRWLTSAVPAWIASGSIPGLARLIIQ